MTKGLMQVFYFLFINAQSLDFSVGDDLKKKNHYCLNDSEYWFTTYLHILSHAIYVI